MKKCDYNIDCAMHAANMLTQERWEACRKRDRRYHSVYDIRLHESKRKHYHRWLKNTELLERFTSQYDGDNWEVNLPNFRVIRFEGFVNRVLQQKGNQYYVELKSLEQESFDIESGWIGFNELNPIVPEAKKIYRYTYEPYVPGNAVKLQYLKLTQPDTNYDFQVNLHVKVENNWRSDA